MDLASPKQPWNWGTEQDIAFAKLLELLCNPPVLKLPDFERPFVIDTDACKDATGAVFVSFQFLNQLSLKSKGSITSVDLLLAPRAHLKHLKSHCTCGDSPLMYIAT